jgi:hypothetical protein
MNVADGELRVLTWDGSLTQLNRNGQVTARQIVDASKMEKLVKELSTVPDSAAMAAARRHAPRGRIVKTVAPAGEWTAVGYWGGTLQLLDKSGEVKNTESFSQDVAGLIWFDGKLVVGLSDGRLLGLERRP